ncbi:MAG TPA: alpha-galactosidase [Patescibacteria group bacterium]|nr:alpha-galactosidase [Patescibacteria group bacterium]
MSGKTLVWKKQRRKQKEKHFHPFRTILIGITILSSIIFVLYKHQNYTANSVSAASQPSYNGLALTPPMGWNPYNHFNHSFNEQIVEQSADAMATNGMQAAGYTYINLDDTWMAGTRDANGNLQPNLTKFPHGIKAVADYVHSKGFKFGIYEAAGKLTCAKTPGSYGHYQQDANLFASWGVDFVKYDWCFQNPLSQQTEFTEISNALLQTGRPIVLGHINCATCTNPGTWAPSISNAWGSFGDIKDTWSGSVPSYATNQITMINDQVGLAQYAGPGHWNDMDFLEVGNGGMTDTEYQSEFSMWSVLAAPLIAGNDVRSMTQATINILENNEVIAIDQDSAGMEGNRISSNSTGEVWARPLANGDYAVVLLNTSSSAATMSTTTQAIGVPQASSYTLRDLWAHVTTTQTSNVITAIIPSHGVAMYRITPNTNGTIAPTPTPTALPTPSATPTPLPTGSATPTPTPVSSILAQDTFVRPNQTFWGSASDGINTWMGDAQVNSGYSIVNNTGHINNVSSSVALIGPSVANAEVLLSGSLSGFNTERFGGVLRYTSGSYYKTFIDGKNLQLKKHILGSDTTLQSVSFPALANTSYSIRMRVQGTTLSAKVWQTGTPEPANWMITVTDTSLASGQSGTFVNIGSDTATFTLYRVVQLP